MLDVKKERKKSGRNISLLAYQTFNLPAFHFYSPCWPIRSAPGHIIAEGQRGEVRGFPRKDPVQALPPPCCSLRGSDGLPIKDASRWLTKGGHNSRARVLGSSRSLAGRANTVVLRRVAPKRTAVRVQREEEEEEEDKKAGGERERARRGTCQPCEICTHISMARISIATTANWLRL